MTTVVFVEEARIKAENHVGPTFHCIEWTVDSETECCSHTFPTLECTIWPTTL